VIEDVELTRRLEGENVALCRLCIIGVFRGSFVVFRILERNVWPDIELPCRRMEENDLATSEGCEALLCRHDGQMYSEDTRSGAIELVGSF
jgi:hypothetical protein